MLEALEFQTDQAYAALERATKTFFLPDAQHAHLLYSESMGSLLKKMIEDEQGKKTYCPPWEKKERDFHIVNYARSEFERFVLEYTVGSWMASGIMRLHDLSNYGCYGGRLPGDRKIADEKERNDALVMTKIDLSHLPHELKHLAETFKDGSWKEEKEESGLDEERGMPKKTTYDFFYVIIGAGSSHLIALGDCPQAREMVKILNVIPKIRELYPSR